MKRLLYTFLLLGLVVGSFWAGSWSTKPLTTTDNPSAVILKGMTGESQSQELDSPGIVKISIEKQQILGVKTATVENKAELHTLRMLGRVAVDDRKVYVVNSATSGWVREVSPITVGSFVQKEQALAVFYSPEFLSAEQSYFYALNTLERFSKEEAPNTSQLTLTKANIRQYSDTLRNLGMGEKQIEEIGRSRTFTDIIKIASPSAGIVISRNIYSGQRFERGTEFFKIADLRSVWILLDAFENEARYLEPGGTVKVLHPHLNKTFQAKVSGDLPQFDPNTRTLKVRLAADNPDYLLRPDMFVDVEYPIQLPEAITVPADAVLDSGLKKTVFVDQGNGYFEPREVQTGLRMGNRVEIIKGLEAGEIIVTSGTFLIDSESKLQLAAAGMQAVLAKDPVCGLEVSPRKAEKDGRKAYHQGKTYYFCSEEHKKQFENVPTRYLKE
jgi:membrane fusion protein, copper/silver efflux system